MLPSWLKRGSGVVVVSQFEFVAASLPRQMAA
jgi:hypothetical protein